jgi:methylated-DNA-[protein]-cysteine S-methyltransferase
LEKFYFADNEIDGIKFCVITSSRGIRNISFHSLNKKFAADSLTRLRPNDPYLYNSFKQLSEYFSLRRKVFNLKLDLVGTEFQIRVWNELLKIPYGKVISYKELALRLGNISLIRAVGRANGANPIPIVIPCHRVIGANGKLVGYGGGLKIKEKLLELEGSRSLELFN